MNSLDTPHINGTETTELWSITTHFKRTPVPHYNTSSYPLIVWTYTNIALQLESNVWLKTNFSPMHN
jgi:hypothetical protein